MTKAAHFRVDNGLKPWEPALFHPQFSFTLVPAHRNRGIGRRLPDGLKRIAGTPPASRIMSG
jgi:hypothetical protein